MKHRLALTVYLTAWATYFAVQVGTITNSKTITWAGVISAVGIVAFAALLGALAAIEWRQER